jgi:hypothetical protein
LFEIIALFVKNPRLLFRGQALRFFVETASKARKIYQKSNIKKQNCGTAKAGILIEFGKREDIILTNNEDATEGN